MTTDARMTDECAACGITRAELPVEIVKDDETGEEIEIQRFHIEDSVRGLWACDDHDEIYRELLPLASRYDFFPEERNMLMVQADALGAVDLLKKMINQGLNVKS